MLLEHILKHRKVKQSFIMAGKAQEELWRVGHGGERKRGGVGKDKGGQIYGDERGYDFGWGTHNTIHR